VHVHWRNQFVMLERSCFCRVEFVADPRTYSGMSFRSSNSENVLFRSLKLCLGLIFIQTGMTHMWALSHLSPCLMARVTRQRAAWHLRVALLGGAVWVRGQLRTATGRPTPRACTAPTRWLWRGTTRCRASSSTRARVERAVHRHRRAPRLRPWAAVARRADGGHVRRGLLLLPLGQRRIQKIFQGAE